MLLTHPFTAHLAPLAPLAPYSWRGVVFALLFVALPVSAEERPDSFATLAEELSPSVVNISTSTLARRDNNDDLEFPPDSPFKDFFDEFLDRNNRPSTRALGSGFLVSEDGYVVTNRHVINGADKIHVTLYNDRRFEAELIGHDSKTDIAVLKIDPDGEVLQAVAFGDSGAMRVGDWVLAIGNPFGLGGSVTAGIISARGRDIGSGPYDDFLQTDAAINRGNSGGPLFNLEGEVVGINTAIFSQTGGSVGIGFAIASNLARNVVEQLRAHGKTRRGWLGVAIQEVTPYVAESFELDEAKGALVSSLHREGPAEAAGLEIGDVVVTFDGKPIDTSRSLPRIVAESAIGKPLDIVVIRDGAPLHLKVTLGVLEEAEQAGLLARADTPRTDKDGGLVFESLGLQVDELTTKARQQLSIAENIKGVLIVGIASGSPAENSALEIGGVIMRVGKVETETLDAFRQAIEAELKAEKNKILLYIYQQGRAQFFELNLES